MGRKLYSRLFELEPVCLSKKPYSLRARSVCESVAVWYGWSQPCLQCFYERSDCPCRCFHTYHVLTVTAELFLIFLWHENVSLKEKNSTLMLRAWAESKYQSQSYGPSWNRKYFIIFAWLHTTSPPESDSPDNDPRTYQTQQGINRFRLISTHFN